MNSEPISITTRPRRPVRRSATSVPHLHAVHATETAEVNRGISHNLNGQRFGRKGRDTRDRIVAAARDILSQPDGASIITLSEVARQASLRIGTLYLYFANMSELVLAVLEPVMATAEDEYVHLLRDQWPTKSLDKRALGFVRAYHGFWVKHSELLHLRNTMSDGGDERMLAHRVRSALPVMRLIASQMGSQPSMQRNLATSTATALMTGLERVATVMTDSKISFVVHEPANPMGLLLQAQARLFTLAIKDQREQLSAAFPST